jgi:hypothetical protein
MKTAASASKAPAAEYLSVRDLSRRWGGSPSPKTLYNWRSMTPPRGPVGTRFGREIKYKLADVVAYEARRTANGAEV